MENQVTREYQENKPQLIKFIKKVCDLLEHFKAFEIMYVHNE